MSSVSAQTSTLVAGNHVPEHVIAGLDPATGDFVLNPTNIDPAAMTVAAGATPSNSTENQIEGEQQRTGLEAVNGQVYVGFGGLSGDCGPYHGFVVDVNESDGSIARYFESATSTLVQNDREGAVWAPGGMAINTSDDTLYASTGNSQDMTAPPADQDYSQGVVQLPLTFTTPPTPTTPTNVFQPSTFVADNDGDLDLSSVAPLLVNGTRRCSRSASAAPGTCSKSRPRVVNQLSVCSGGSFGSAATLGTSIFVPCRGSVMKQLVPPAPAPRPPWPPDGRRRRTSPWAAPRSRTRAPIWCSRPTRGAANSSA